MRAMRRLCLLVPLLAVAAVSSLAQGTIVVVSDSDCRWLTRHVPDADVAYVPGRDVRGRSVAPADLPGSTSLNLPREIPIALTIPLTTFLGEATPPFLADAEVTPGTVTVDRDTGAVAFNGVPVTKAGKDHLIAACKAKRKSP